MACKPDPALERRAAEATWPGFEPRPPLALVWGGQPATLEKHGEARLDVDHVARVAAELHSHDEAYLRAAYARQRPYIATVLDEADVLSCHERRRGFFAEAATRVSEVVIWWELG